MSGDESGNLFGGQDFGLRFECDCFGFALGDDGSGFGLWPFIFNGEDFVRVAEIGESNGLSAGVVVNVFGVPSDEQALRVRIKSFEVAGSLFAFDETFSFVTVAGGAGEVELDGNLVASDALF